jgi:nicotinate-nucleotide adenylyltransferase
MIGILGSSFDPIHVGHLRVAHELKQDLNFTEVRFIPSGHPPHRSVPVASDAQRLAMIKAAITDQPGFTLDDRELRRRGPSYTIDTLTSLRAELADDIPLCLIVGQDAFVKLDTWQRWLELINLAHIVVIPRPGQHMGLSDKLKKFLADRRITDPHLLTRQVVGCILNWPVTQLDIASSQIRALLTDGKSIRYLVPDAVEKIIRSEGIYLNNDQQRQEGIHIER